MYCEPSSKLDVIRKGRGLFLIKNNESLLVYLRVDGATVKHDQEVVELLIRNRVNYQVLFHEPKNHAVVKHAHHPQ